MGADLYIQKDSNEDTGYFRDSYNETNIFWRLDLSYWSLESQIPIGKIKRVMTLKQVKILRKEVEARKPLMEKFFTEVTEDWLKEHHCEKGVEVWVKFWREKYEKFVKFLDHAIELRSGIRWSC